MPMPTPSTDEQRDQFIRRFMSDATMRREYPDQSQRAAVANSQWRKHLKATTSLPMKSGGDLEFVCALSTEAAQEGQPGKFTMSLYSGGPMRPRGYKEDVVLDIKGLKLSSNMVPILADHSNHTDAVVGQGTVTIQGGKVVVSGLTTKSTTAGKRVSAMLKEGIPLQASIGADNVKVVRLSRDEVINGRTIKAGRLVVRSARLREATVTPLGGDSETSVLAASRQSSSSRRRGGHPSWPTWPSQSREIPMTFQEFVASLGLDASNLTDDQKTVLQAAFDNRESLLASSGGTPATPASPAPSAGGTTTPASGTIQGSDDTPQNSPQVDKLFAALEQVFSSDDDDDQQVDVAQLQANLMTDLRNESASERERQRNIDTLTASYNDRVSAEDLTRLQAQAIRDNWHPDQLELELLRAARPDAAAFAIHSHNEGSAPADVIEASLLLASGRMSEEQVGKQFNEETMNRASEARNRGYGLRRLAHETIQAAGMYTPPGQYDNNFVRTMIRADDQLSDGRDLYAAASMGGVSTVSVSSILSNVMHKLLLQSFTGDSNGMNALQMISTVRSVSDFKDHHIYRLTADGSYRQIAAGGDLKYMSLQEAENKINAQTYGVMLSLNRQMIINDDLNAFSKVPSLIGRQARMKFLREGWTTFLDNANFYTAARGNLIMPSGGLSIETLTEATIAFSKIRDDNGDPVDTTPRTLLVGSANQVLADQLYRDLTVLAPQSYPGKDLISNQNPHRGKYQPYATSWIDGTGALVPGGSDDEWYMFSGEQDMMPLQVAYLNGNRTPYLERIDLPADKLGMGWRSYFDFGFARQEWRGSIKVVPTTVKEGDKSAPKQSAPPQQPKKQPRK